MKFLLTILFSIMMIVPINAETGVASYYGTKRDGLAGGRTASGERVNNTDFTAAHRTRPFGSYVNVYNHHNGRSVRVRINDRGPFVKGRVIDLSPAAAAALGIIGSGTAIVTLR